MCTRETVIGDAKLNLYNFTERVLDFAVDEYDWIPDTEHSEDVEAIFNGGYDGDIEEFFGIGGAVEDAVDWINDRVRSESASFHMESGALIATYYCTRETCTAASGFDEIELDF